MTLFIMFVMAMIWLLQTVFLEPYYEYMRTADVRRVASELVGTYGQADFQDRADEISFKDNVSIIVFDADGKALHEANNFGIRAPFGPPPTTRTTTDYDRDQQIFIEEQLFASSIKALKDQNGDVLLLNIDNDKIKSSILLLVTEIKDDYLFLSTEIRPIDATATILSSQLKIITLIVFILAALISILIAISIARPLSRITVASRELSKNRFPDDCKGGSYSETRELAETLRKTATELNKAENLRREFIGNISHDLRTPMTMIKAYAEAVRDLPDDDPARKNKDLSIIIHESDRLAELIKDLLELSKLESGSSALDLGRFSLTALIREVLASYKLYQDRDGYAFSFDYDQEIMVLADKRKLEQVLHNLIHNAIIHTGTSHRVAIRQISAEDKARIEIIDSGEGIPEEQLPHIWDRYFKIKANTGRAEDGSGLGLSIVKSALELHGASYGAENSPQGGAVFWFELSLKIL